MASAWSRCKDLLLDGTGYVWDDTHPQVVISSADFAVIYDKLRRACLAIRAGADWIATTPIRPCRPRRG